MDQRTDQSCGRYGGNREAATKRRGSEARSASRFRLSPVNRRRLERFKAHKLGYRSFLIFSGLFLITLFAEFIANDRPLIDQLQGRNSVSRSRRLSGRKVRRLPRRHRLPHARHRQRDQRQRLDALAADPLLLRHDQQGLSRPHRRKRHLPRLSRAATLVIVTEALRCAGRSGRALRRTRQHQLARPRQPRPRRGCARHLRLSDFGAVRSAS